MIDRTRTAGNLFIYEHLDRCRYLGKSARDQSRSFEGNPDKWVRIEDVRQEDASRQGSCRGRGRLLGARPAEPSDPTSSNDVRQAGDALAGGFIPPAKAMSEEPNAETTPRVGRKRGQRRGRQCENEKLPSEVAKAGRMLSPERMRIVLDSLRERPFLFEAARNAGIYPQNTSIFGASAARPVTPDCGQVEWQGVIWRFHEHCETAVEEAEDTILAVAWDMCKRKDRSGGQSQTERENAPVSLRVEASRQVGQASKDRRPGEYWRAYRWW